MNFSAKTVQNLTEMLKNLNMSFNMTTESQVGPEWGSSLWIRYGVFFPIFLVTLLGNLMVITVVIRIRKLHTPSNYLIASLAVTDFLTSCFLPHEFLAIGVGSVWPFSPLMCQLRYATVILCCIASTHHLLAIAIDRYLLVTNVLYSQTRQPKKIFYIIAFVWTESVLISLSPVFGWHNPDFFKLIDTSACFVVISQSLQVFVGFISFYIPFIVMIVLYWQMFLVVHNRIKCKANAMKMKKMSRTSDNSELSSNDKTDISQAMESDLYKGSKLSATEFADLKQKKLAMDSRERKTALTLFLVSGVFIICWGPWFITETTGHWYGLNPDPGIRTLFYWLTVCNSTINPFIYTIFIPSFREGFKQLYKGCFHCKTILKNIKISSDIQAL